LRAVLLLAAFTAAAQSPASNWDNVKAITTGTELRIAIGSRTLRGDFVRATDDTLVVASGKGQEMFTQQEVERVSIRGHSHRGRNALIGLGAGAVVGLIVAGVQYKKCTGLCFFGSPSRGAAMAGGAIGMGMLGAAAGALTPTRGWREVYKK
jgi:hypothetical protein